MSQGKSSSVTQPPHLESSIDSDEEEHAQHAQHVKRHRTTKANKHQVAKETAAIIAQQREKIDENAARHLNSQGKYIDYVLVAKIPREESDRLRYQEQAKGPKKRHEELDVAHYRKRNFFLEEVKKAGLEVEEEISPDRTHVFYKIHTPFPVLCQEAEYLEWNKPLKPELAGDINKVLGLQTLSQKFMSYLTPPKCIRRIFDHGLPTDETNFSANFIVSGYHNYEGSENADTFFNRSERTMLTDSLLSKCHYGNKRSQLGLKKVLHNGSIAAAFPLHDGPFDPVRSEKEGNYDKGLPDNERAVLYEHWTAWKNLYKKQPHDLIKKYFGVRVALYFALMGHYLTFLTVPAFVGFWVFIYGCADYTNQIDAQQLCANNITPKVICAQCDPGCDQFNLTTACSSYQTAFIFDNYVTVAFSFFVVLWSTVFINFWKRRNAQLRFHWDMMDYSEDEPDRPPFHGTHKRLNPITGREEKFYPTVRRIVRQMGTFSLVLTATGVVVIIVVAIVIYRLAVRAELYKTSSNASDASTDTSITASLINLAAIMTLAYFYDGVAEQMTEWENHQKESDFQASLTLKIFIFNFVNYYSAIGYIAFFKGKLIGYPTHYTTVFGYREDQCEPGGCMQELTIEMVTIMLGKGVFAIIEQLLLPQLFRWIRWCSADEALKENKKKLYAWERDYLDLDPFPPRYMFFSYQALTINYGFVTMFVPAFCLAPLSALLFGTLQLRTDAHIYLCDYRRPAAWGASDVGMWFDLLEFVTYLCVVTNGVIIAFTSSFIPKIVYSNENNGSLSGYIDSIYALSPAPAGDPDYGCYYLSFRDPDGHKGRYFYLVLSAQLAFLVLFENLVFVLKVILEIAIPDVPASVKLAMDREEHLKQAALDAGLLGAGGGGDADGNKTSGRLASIIPQRHASQQQAQPSSGTLRPRHDTNEFHGFEVGESSTTPPNTMPR